MRFVQNQNLLLSCTPLKVFMNEFKTSFVVKLCIGIPEFCELKSSFVKKTTRPYMLTFAIVKLDLVGYFLSVYTFKRKSHYISPFTPPICYTTYIINLYALHKDILVRNI